MEPAFIQPNLHIILVHYPLALLVTGTLIELLGFFWRRHSFRGAGRWMILLGALSGIPTALSGVYAFYDVARAGATGLPPGAVPWREVARASPLSAQQWDLLTYHLRFESIGIALAVLAALTWVACSDWLRTRLNAVLLLLLLAALGLILAGAYHGGEAVYRHGTGVAMAHDLPHPAIEIAPTTMPATTQAVSITVTSTSAPATAGAFNFDKITYYAPPMQLHVILAGCSIALALAALALSIRKLTQAVPPTQVDHIAAAFGSGAVGDLDLPAPMEDLRDMIATRVPAARFWMLALLGVLLTAGIGYFMLATDVKTWSLNDLWKGFIKDNVRQMIHVIGGGALVLLPLILAILARWAPRQRFLLAFFTLLVLAVVTAQIWIGALMLFDTRTGAWNRFN